MQTRRLIFLLLMMVIFVQVICIFQYTTSAHWEDVESTEIEDTKIILNEDEIKAYELINEYRLENGLPKLKYSGKLQEVAKIKAQDLVESEYFSHTSLTFGSTFNIMKDKNIKYKVAGENLAGNISPEKAVEAWINSETHKANILDEEYNHTAIAVVESEIYGKIFVELFVEM